MSPLANKLLTGVRVVGIPLALWVLFLGLLISLVRTRSHSGQEYDEAALREWIQEARIFRDTLPELVRKYLAIAVDPHAEPAVLATRSSELHDQLTSLADPLRIYASGLPLFPNLYRLELQFATDRPGSPPPIIWESQIPRPRDGGQVHRLTEPISTRPGQEAYLQVEYQLHAFNKRQRDEIAAAQRLRWVSALALAATAITFLWVYLAHKSERKREERRLLALRQADQAERQALAAELSRKETARLQDETQRRLLEQELATQAAERQALQLQSQLYASIGIMAGSYAHNIKNLLVRPNDLLRRCQETDSLSPEQNQMLSEVRQTLHTVTDRLHEILQTVRRHPTRPQLTTIDLNLLIHDIEAAWRPIAQDKWKLSLSTEVWAEPLLVKGDQSHLQQAIENLLFNARDATFEMRNYLRDQAYQLHEGRDRKEALLQAASWRGSITIRTRSMASDIPLPSIPAHTEQGAKEAGNSRHPMQGDLVRTSPLPLKGAEGQDEGVHGLPAENRVDALPQSDIGETSLPLTGRGGQPGGVASVSDAHPQSGRLAILEICDNGIGMTDEVRARCLEPHFSTKRDNAYYESYSTGMGLGLSFVAAILDHHHARLEVESARYGGTMFRIVFDPASKGVDA
jgi:signal transduction histidine kinase